MPIKFLNSGLLEGSLQLTSYGSGSISGTGAYNLGVDASGNVIETSLIEGSGTSNYVVKWTPDGNTLGNSQIFDNGTNVGIGTALPQRLLHLDSGTSTAWFRLQGGGGFGKYTDIYNNDDDFQIHADATGGATSSGTINFVIGSGDITTLYASGQVYFWQYGSGTFTGTAVKNLSVTSSGKIIETDVAVDGSGTLNYVTKWTPDGDTLGDSIIFDNGTNVGIGTTSPDEKLEIAGDVKIQGADSGNAGVLHFGNDSDQVKIAGFDSGGSSVQNSLLFYTNTTERMRIDSSGNVGIGFSNPTSKIVIVNSSNQGGGVIENSNGSFNQTGLLINNTSSTSGELFRLRSTGANRFVVTGSGNVGIGTDSPDTKLTIEGDSPIINIRNTAESESGINFVDTASAAQSARIMYDSGSSNALIFYNNAITERMRITSSGNLKINTTVSTLGKLSVKSDSGANTFYNNIQCVPSDSNTGGLFIGSNVANDAIMVTGAYYANAGNYTPTSTSASIINMFSGNIVFRANESLTVGTNYVPTERMRITSGGSVGIGTNVPEAKLGVFGGGLGSTAGDSVTHAQIRGDRQRLDFKEVRTSNGSDWNNTTYKLQMRVDSTNHQSIDFVSDASFAEHIDIYTNNQQFNTRFSANGNVGIGTDSPSTKLEVDGNIQANNSGGAVVNLKNTNTSMTPPEAYGTINFVSSEPNSGTVAYIKAERGLNNSAGSAQMKFYTAPSAPFSPSLALSILQNKYVEFEYGARFKKSGGSFGSLLNYYQRGTFTPSYSGITVYAYGTRYGYYERIGDWVHVQIEISTGYVSGASTTQAAKITGLPFTVGRAVCCPTYVMQPTGAMSDISLMGSNFESTKAVPVGVVGTTDIQFEYTDKGSTGKTVVTGVYLFRQGGNTNGNHMQVTISYLAT